jgi:hypothetical protein
LDVFVRNEIAAFRRRNAFLDGCNLPFLDRKELLDCLSGQSRFAAAYAPGNGFKALLDLWSEVNRQGRAVCHGNTYRSYNLVNR